MDTSNPWGSASLTYQIDANTIAMLVALYHPSLPSQNILCDFECITHVTWSIVTVTCSCPTRGRWRLWLVLVPLDAEDGYPKNQSEETYSDDPLQKLTMLSHVWVQRTDANNTGKVFQCLTKISQKRLRIMLNVLVVVSRDNLHKCNTVTLDNNSIE